MLSWLSQNWGTLLIAAVLLLVVGAVIGSMVKNRRRKKPSCGCNCASCSLHCGSEKR